MNFSNNAKRGAMPAAISDQIKKTIDSLKKNRFDAHFAENTQKARDIMLNMIPLSAVVGIADSVTLRQAGTLDELAKRGNKVINPFTPEMTRDIDKNPARHKLFLSTLRSTFGTDVFITGSNAITEDGKIVSIDGAGNRVAGIIYAAPKVILTVGRNKIVKDADAAIYRIKNVIAPVHARQKNYATPCAKTGKCADCNSPQRICSVTMILEKKPYHAEISVIIIDADLGLSWDPGWDEKRIKAIIAGYHDNSWPF
jgi:L-lactate utilization protein LutB